MEFVISDRLFLSPSNSASNETQLAYYYQKATESGSYLYKSPNMSKDSDSNYIHIKRNYLWLQETEKTQENGD